MDDVADHLMIPNSTVVILERDQGIMDLISWVEGSTFNLTDYSIFERMVSRVDVKRSANWFRESVDLLKLVKGINPKMLLLLGAVIPAWDDTKR